MRADVAATVERVLAEHESVESGCSCGGDCGWTHGEWQTHVAAKVAAALAATAVEVEHDDRPACSCAMTESSLHACEFHGERGACRCGEPWIDHPEWEPVDD